MVAVVSWILIECSFISWELTSQIDVSLNWVLVRDTWGITLLTLVCLCCEASGGFVLALMGSINSASPLIIIVLLFARGYNNWRFYGLFVFLLNCLGTAEALFSWCLHKKFTLWESVFAHFLSHAISSSQPLLSKRTIHKGTMQKKKKKDSIWVIQQSLFNDLTSLTCTLKKQG